MDNNNKVKVISTDNGIVSVSSPQVNFKHVWPTKGSFCLIPKETIEQLLFETGFAALMRDGVLYIEDLEVKKELGLEPEDAKEPVNIIVLTDKDRRRYMVNLSLPEFTKKVNELSHEQVMQLADYAVANRLADFEKANVLKDLCGRDIIQSIRLSEQDKEE